MAQLKGVDISRWQGIINWDQVKGAVQFAIIKATGGDDGLYVDGQFKRNRNEARRVGLLRGYYHFAGGAYAAEEEADYFVEAIGAIQKGEVLVLDWERSHANPVAWCLAFLKRVELRTGIKPLLYINGSTSKSFNWSPVVKNNNGLWVADWGPNNGAPKAGGPNYGYWPFWALWQTSSVGSVAGIGGRVDTDLFNGTPEQFVKYGNADHVPAPAPNPPPRPAAPKPQPSGQYTVLKGDNLSSIAAKFGTTWQVIWALNRSSVANPDRIYTNQKLNVPGGVAPAANKNYTVVKGDNLSSIAAKYHTSWQQLYSWNRKIIGPNPDLIKPGQILRVR